MNTAALGLQRTPALRDFKSNAGQNNHFLITVLVGLDAIRSGTADLNEEFATSWNPRDKTRSADRSRSYALMTSFAWITDLIDVYRKRLTHLPGLLTPEQIKAIDTEDGRSLRLRALAKELAVPLVDPELLLVQLAIKWRNDVIHSDSNKKLNSQLRSDLMRHQVEIAETHRGLDISRMINSCEQFNAPTFKEVASVISATHAVASTLDRSALKLVTVDTFVEGLLQKHLSDRFVSNSQVFAQFWPGVPGKTRQRITALLIQEGMSPEGRESDTIGVEYLEQLTHLSATEARGRFLG